jgi:RsiW-degrading membrane proteinase PrsW (M82 family)
MSTTTEAPQHEKAHRGVELFNALVPVKAWIQDRQLRSWQTILLVFLMLVPAYVLTQQVNQTSLAPSAWILVTFFAVAWLLLLWVIVRPEHIRLQSFALVAGLALLVEFPMAIAMEKLSGGGTSNPFAGTFEVGLPEELAKMVPLVVIAVLAIRGVQWARNLQPRDYLFLGVVSGLVFGAVEAEEYFAQGLEAAGSGQQTTLLYILRFLTDPVIHALWAGIAGYFIGLAVQQYRQGMAKLAAITLGCVGLGIAAVLHGLNDWLLSGQPGLNYLLVVLVGALLFLGYARVGASPDALQAAVQAPPKAKEETS